jgi:hypothetical protein
MSVRQYLHYFAPAILLGTLVACSNGRVPVLFGHPYIPRQADVRFADYNRDGALADHGAGTAYVFKDAIKVVLRNGVFAPTPTPRLRLVALSAGLAHGDTARRWDVSRESPKVVTTHMKFRGDTLADSVVFWIFNTRGVNLSTHWLMLREYAQVYIAARGTWANANRPIHGDLDLFRRAGIAR